MINELPKEVSYSYKNIFLYICLFLLVAGGIGTALYFLISRKKSCKTDKDCKSGQTCNGGKCQPVAPPASGCNTDKDCASGNTCQQGKCKSVSKKNTGDHCANNSECASDACGYVTNDSVRQCCAGHTFTNTINGMSDICSLDKGGNPCYENIFCTSCNCDVNLECADPIPGQTC